MAALTDITSSPRRRGDVGARLPWWAVALPAVTFFALLLLIVSGGGADAAEYGEPGTRLLERIEAALPG
ncbi:hypothetical protein LHJ74_33900 [Streptomyces sp. N2-109]|uniref:ABC transporter permease n=1 Tax=Streptomyces gossypii TaxID=2883101 RepID=A0ABT2K5R6_9ACTN|nr:hypothetical protein [Streptomyces gossypii]MCT2594849.1 hypothetical protein [Streptomyces gossypii]